MKPIDIVKGKIKVTELTKKQRRGIMSKALLKSE
jgi:hypothetical protein